VGARGAGVGACEAGRSASVFGRKKILDTGIPAWHHGLTLDDTATAYRQHL